jgi:hypothetical protein
MASPLLEHRIAPQQPEIGHKVPWKAIAGGALVGGLGLGAGYIGGGLITKNFLESLPHSLTVDWFRSLAPEHQRLLLTGVGGLAGAVGSAALLGRSTAYGAHIQNASDDLNAPQPVPVENPKEAMVREAYRAIGIR